MKSLSRKTPWINAFVPALFIASCASSSGSAWSREFPTEGLAVIEGGIIDLALNTDDWLLNSARGGQHEADIFQISEGFFIPDNARSLETGEQRYALVMEEPPLRIERSYYHANRNLRQRSTSFERLPEGIKLSWLQGMDETPLPAPILEGSIEGLPVRVFATKGLRPPALFEFLGTPGSVDPEWAMGFEGQKFQVVGGEGLALAELEGEGYRIFDSGGAYGEEALRKLLVIVRAASRFAWSTEDFVARQRSAVADGRPMPDFPYRFEGK